MQLNSPSRNFGGLLASPGHWRLGMGFKDGQPALDAKATIDEVRISSRPLASKDFLFYKAKSTAAPTPPAVVKIPDTPKKFFPIKIRNVKHDSDKKFAFKIHTDGAWKAEGADRAAVEKVTYTVETRLDPKDVAVLDFVQATGVVAKRPQRRTGPAVNGAQMPTSSVEYEDRLGVLRGHVQLGGCQSR